MGTLPLAALLFAISPSPPYDPLAAGPEPAMVDRTFPGELAPRAIPVRIFLPADRGPAPVILFSHGLGGSREGSNFLGRHWSSRGYVTVFLQHPGSDTEVWRGRTPADAMTAMKRAASFGNYILRVGDVGAVLTALERANADPADPLHGRLDLEHVGMSGHPFGAKTTQAVSGERIGSPDRPKSLKDPRIRAAVVMSPSPADRNSPEFSFHEVNIPWLLMTGTEDHAPAGIAETTPSDRLKVFDALPPGDKFELVLDGAGHSVFTDRRLPFDKYRRNPNHHRAILAISTAFWDAFLKGNAEARAWLHSKAVGVLQAGDSWRAK